MLDHRNAKPQAPKRVVILGAGGFVGGAAKRQFERARIDVLGLTRADVDLLTPGAAESLQGRLREDDALVVVSARAPCKDNAMLLDNLAMMQAVCAALEKRPVAHVVYVSSDAVYADSAEPLTENSCAEPGSLHGIMHIAREVMLKSVVDGTPLAILRPTLIYGGDDPHNGYGPNRFRRLAAEGKEIVLFGEGEERRDHVWVEDVAALIGLMVAHRSAGALNAATGRVISFKEIAELVVGHFPKPVAIKGSPRQGPMPHDGFRPFDPAGTRKAFPDFRYTDVADGLARVHQETAGK